MATSADIRIRPALATEVDELARMRLELQKYMESRNPSLAPMSEARKEQLSAEYRERLAAEETRILVATVGAEPQIRGMAIASVSDREDLVPPRWGRIDDVWVDEPFRRLGVARRMLADIVEFFTSRDAASVVLEYSVGNREAEATWKAAGFTPVLTIAVADSSQLLSKFKPGAA